MGLVEAVLLLLAVTLWLVEHDRRHIQRSLELHDELVRAFRRHAARQLRAQRRRIQALEEDVGHELLRLEQAVEKRPTLFDEPTCAIPRQILRQAELRASEASRRERFGGTPRILEHPVELPEATAPIR